MGVREVTKGGGSRDLVGDGTGSHGSDAVLIVEDP